MHCVHLVLQCKVQKKLQIKLQYINITSIYLKILISKGSNYEIPCLWNNCA